jgi:hypothetical protein
LLLYKTPAGFVQLLNRMTNWDVAWYFWAKAICRC